MKNNEATGEDEFSQDIFNRSIEFLHKDIHTYFQFGFEEHTSEKMDKESYVFYTKRKKRHFDIPTRGISTVKLILSLKNFEKVKSFLLILR